MPFYIMPFDSMIVQTCTLCVVIPYKMSFIEGSLLCWSVISPQMRFPSDKPSFGCCEENMASLSFRQCPKGLLNKEGPESRNVIKSSLNWHTSGSLICK